MLSESVLIGKASARLYLIWYFKANAGIFLVNTRIVVPHTNTNMLCQIYYDY